MKPALTFSCYKALAQSLLKHPPDKSNKRVTLGDGGCEVLWGKRLTSEAMAAHSGERSCR